MKDNLDEFIRDHKEAFDDKEVSNELWNRIEVDLNPDAAKRDYSWVWKIASVFFIGATLVLLLDKFQQSNQPIQYAGYNQELIDVENYYSQLISTKRFELEEKLTEEEKKNFLSELDNLDAMYDMLKGDLVDNKKNNKLISAMIQNLQLRVEILNKQLNILERIHKVEKDEKITI